MLPLLIFYWVHVLPQCWSPHSLRRFSMADYAEVLDTAKCMDDVMKFYFASPIAKFYIPPIIIYSWLEAMCAVYETYISCSVSVKMPMEILKLAPLNICCGAIDSSYPCHHFIMDLSTRKQVNVSCSKYCTFNRWWQNPLHWEPVKTLSATPEDCREWSIHSSWCYHETTDPAFGCQRLCSVFNFTMLPPGVSALP